jgi:hypothetical protein
MTNNTAMTTKAVCENEAQTMSLGYLHQRLESWISTMWISSCKKNLIRCRNFSPNDEEH